MFSVIFTVLFATYDVIVADLRAAIKKAADDGNIWASTALSLYDTAAWVYSSYPVQWVLATLAQYGPIMVSWAAGAFRWCVGLVQQTASCYGNMMINKALDAAPKYVNTDSVIKFANDVYVRANSQRNEGQQEL
uniref:Uncharacterized protein n=1 Tax=Spongospora subterranea TaxID=70186 RepID=A0A0H5RA04_9EUKA|eukprot:CRZ10913.1 hypothetical protein [Spongospora subterranea]